MIRRPALALALLPLSLLQVASLAQATSLGAGAQDTVTRLARAGGVPLTGVTFASADATRRIAQAFTASGRCVSENTLSRLGQSPQNAGLQAMLYLEFRCVTRIGGKALTPGQALTLLRGLGYDFRTSAGLLELLNNPPPTNALLQASGQPVTPLTPRN